jgi:hypothetical protein
MVARDRLERAVTPTSVIPDYALRRPVRKRHRERERPALCAGHATERDQRYAQVLHANTLGTARESARTMLTVADAFALTKTFLWLLAETLIDLRDRFLKMESGDPIGRSG